MGFARKISSRLKTLRHRGETCFVFISDKKIRELNRCFLQKNGTTDVIAFGYDTPGGMSGRFSPPGKIGALFLEMPFADIFISMNTARRHAGENGHSLAQELALLILHALLHLAGYRDDTPSRKKIMFAQQKKLFRAVNPRLAPPDFR